MNWTSCAGSWTRPGDSEATMREYFNPNWTESLFGLLVTATWQAALLALVFTAISAWACRVASRCTLWTVCLIGLIASPVLSLSLPHCFVAYLSSAEPLHFPTHIAQSRVVSLGSTSLWGLAHGEWSGPFCRTLLFLWMAGAMVAIARLAWGW